MKKVKILLLLIMIITLVGCNEKKEENKEEKKEEKEEEKQEELSELDKKVEDTLNNMTLDEKIGQMIIVYYSSSKMDNTLKSALNDVKPGGFILFQENITTYDDTLNFIKEIKSTAKIPMFISIDQEGGNVQRLKKLIDLYVSDIPYMYYVGKTDDENLTYNVGKVIAEELRVFGINMDFAPVLDVFSNPNNTVIGKRSFGTTYEIVSKHGLQLAKGLEDNGVIPVYKHFPGHGNTETDSHYDLPVVNKTKEDLLNSDLVPFIDAIKNDAKVIMIGHLAVPEITKDNTPSSLSKEMITNFLKGELNYNGIVITDALNMKALTNYYKEDEICGKAVEAGVDILLMPTSSRKCLKSVQDAIKNGKVTEKDIDNSVRKILKLKFDKIDDNDTYLDKSYLRSEEHLEILEKIKSVD